MELRQAAMLGLHVLPLVARASELSPRTSRSAAMTMPINIDQLSIEELVALNHRVIARIKLLEQRSTMNSMVKFNVGSRVSFDPDGSIRTGTLIKFNPKTVVVLTDDGQRWKVSPQFLRHLVENQATTKVTPMRRVDRDRTD